ncbi:MAG: HNH endonuclease [Candidatus Kaiserbacteria bacterium]|nr:HNH endonuclease [Candidatus Kaiserbacteria bacterium]
MTNKYGLPEEELKKIRARDTKCVYCHKAMINPSSGCSKCNWATIEHLNHLSPWDNPDTVAYCCGSCNSSRGKKKLPDWFKTPYCVQKNINEKTVAKPVKKYIRKIEGPL